MEGTTCAYLVVTPQEAFKIDGAQKISSEVTLKHGLKTGPKAKVGVRGVYCFRMKKPKLRVKSSGYVVYSELFDDNMYWAPYLLADGLALGCA